MHATRVFGIACGLLLVLACEHADRDRVRPCGPDDEETNDQPGTAWDFGSFADDPNSSRERTATIHTANDVDWYRATVYRRGLGTQPLVTIVASGGTTVTAYHSCEGAPAECVWGRPVTDANGTGCESTSGKEAVVRFATHCKGDQSDVVFRVTAPFEGTCRKYDLRLEVE